MTALVRVNDAAVRSLFRSGAVADALLHVGEQVAERAAQAAPKNTGEGAASIHAEVVRADGYVSVRVSWDARHFYMGFQELGTSRMSARPFLRPALDAHYDV